MSKIQLVQPNYQSKNLQARKKFNSYPAFKGAASLGDDATKIATDLTAKSVRQAIEKKQGIVGYFSRLLNANDGEVQNQVINAIFTTTLAPLFIACNPISTQDKKTKEYTALRQPISAVIAISGGLAMTNAINSYMSTLGSEGHLPYMLDMRIAPDKTYLKPSFKKDFNKAIKDNKLEEFVEKYKSTDWDSEDLDRIKSGKIKNGEKKLLLDNYVKNVKNERIDFFTHLVTENPENIKINEATKEIYILDSSAKDGKKVIGSNIPNMTKKEELDAFVNDHNFRKKTFGSFMNEQFKIEFHEDGQLKKHVLDSKLKNIKAMDFLRKVGLIDEGVTEEDLVKFLSELRQEKETKNQIKKALNPIALAEGGDELLAKATGEQAARIGQLQIGDGFYKSEKMTLGHFFNRLGMDTKALQALMDKKIDKGFESFTTMFNAKKLKGFNPETTIKTIGKKIMSNRSSRLGSDFDVFKTFVMIGFNLITTAVTCTALNWVYPRIVETLFPSLVKDDPSKVKPEGGKK